MAKKETLNPITAFRKANEARKAVVVKSLKKAQEGIAQDTTSNVNLVNNDKNILAKQQYENMIASQKLRNRSDSETNAQNINEAMITKRKLDALNKIHPGYQTPFQKKNGGPVKRKK